MSTDKSGAVDLTAPPTSFTAFKPVGHIVIGFPDNETCGRAIHALQEEGFTEVQQVQSEDMRSNMGQMLDSVSGIAELGHEVVEMRKYLALSAEGYGWLIVPASDNDAARRIISSVEPIGARVAVNYGRLLIEDML